MYAKQQKQKIHCQMNRFHLFSWNCGEKKTFFCSRVWARSRMRERERKRSRAFCNWSIVSVRFSFEFSSSKWPVKAHSGSISLAHTTVQVIRNVNFSHDMLDTYMCMCMLLPLSISISLTLLWLCAYCCVLYHTIYVIVISTAL